MKGKPPAVLSEKPSPKASISEHIGCRRPSQRVAAARLEEDRHEERNGIGRTLLQALGLLSASVLYAQQPDHPAAALESHIMLTPEEIPWRQCPPALPPGAQCAVVEGDMTAANRLFAYRVKMPDNYRIAPHFHPADEHLVVLRGVFNMGMGDELDTRASRPMTAGSFVVMPKEKHHFAWTKGETTVQVYAIGPWGLTYVDAKDDPRNR